VDRAIEQVGHAERLAAGDRVADAARRALAAAARCRLDAHDRASDLDQIGGVASVQRQLFDALVLDDLPDAGAARLDQRRRGLHRHGLAERADRQRHRDFGIRADLQDDAGLLVDAEAGEHRLQAIRPDRQAGQRVGAVLAGDGAAAESGIRLRDGDVDARQDAAAFIANGP
jgi:hypothetical protein